MLTADRIPLRPAPEELNDPMQPWSKKICFLVYDSRSGSTLLATLLNRYAGIAVSQESNVVANVLEYPATVITRENVAALLETLCGEVQFSEWRIDLEGFRSALDAHLPLSRYDFLRCLIAYTIERRGPGAAVAVIKGARPMFHREALMENLADACFIHIYRDGRAVYASKLRSSDVAGNRMERNIVKAAMDWRAKMTLMIDAPGVINVCYEHLLADSDGVLNGLLDRLGLEGADRDITKRSQAYSETIGARQKHLHANVNRRPDPAIAARWESELSDFDKRVYATVNRRLLLRLGYAMPVDARRAPWITRTAVRLYIVCCLLFLMLRKFRKAAVLTGTPSELKKKLIEKMHEYKAMKRRQAGPLR